jgi:hypothetical protein
VPESSVVSGAYSSEFKKSGAEKDGNAEGGIEQVIARTAAFAESRGRRPRLLVAKMGQVTRSFLAFWRELDGFDHVFGGDSAYISQ